VAKGWGTYTALIYLITPNRELRQPKLHLIHPLEEYSLTFFHLITLSGELDGTIPSNKELYRQRNRDYP